MISVIVGLVLLALNAAFGVKDVRHGNTTKSAAFTWFVVGFVASGVMHALFTLL